MTEYIIKVYRVKNLTGIGYSRKWELEYVSDLPYVFSVKPVNICNQMNEMFSDVYEHIISIR